MDIKIIAARAARGLREDVKLYLVAVSSLTVAFLRLSTTLLGLSNVGVLAEQWGRSHRMSVYLRDGVSETDVARLSTALAKLPEVLRAEHTSGAAARATFLAATAPESALRALPSSAFPASIEVAFRAETSSAQVDALAKKLAAQPALVDDVDTYGSWFQRLHALLGAGRAIASGLGLLVLVCVIAVVANTIRLAVASRRDEIEVLKMCGATDAFVRAPFVLEGMLQGFLAAALALGCLLAGFLAMRGEIDETLGSFAGIRLVFLSPAMALAIVLGGAVVGALGSALSVRRYAAV